MNTNVIKLFGNRFYGKEKKNKKNQHRGKLFSLKKKKKSFKYSLKKRETIENWKNL